MGNSRHHGGTQTELIMIELKFPKGFLTSNFLPCSLVQIESNEVCVCGKLVLLLHNSKQLDKMFNRHLYFNTIRTMSYAGSMLKMKKNKIQCSRPPEIQVGVHCN